MQRTIKSDKEQTMHIHILGIGGTFMGGIASLAVDKGHRVTGSDENVYPPMSTQLEALGITLQEGYLASHLEPRPDLVVIGNAMKRGIPAVEYVLNEGIPYQSGPAWLAENILQNKWVIAVAGTHGKTTTSSMVAWILTYADKDPGFLIGGIPANFNVSAKSGLGEHFVVEADEYDCAFFDKRSKFVHYHPRTCVMNNLEFDHADIFNNLAEIQKQFHHLVRTVPGKGEVIVPSKDEALQAVLEMGVWSTVKTFGEKGQWQAVLQEKDGSVFEVYYENEPQGLVQWDLIGQHNVHNALAAIAASFHAGVKASVATQALSEFRSVKRRLEVRGKVNEITVYDDFAHHPTAIKTTIEGLRAKIGHQRLIAVLDIRSNTMKMGTHRTELCQALESADQIFVYQAPSIKWSVQAALEALGERATVYQDPQDLLGGIIDKVKPQDHVLIMSNGGFDNLHERLLKSLSTETA